MSNCEDKDLRRRCAVYDPKRKISNNRCSDPRTQRSCRFREWPKSDRPRARPPARMRVAGRLELIHRTGRPRRIPPPLRDGTVPGSPQATTNVCADLFATNGFDFTAQILLVAPLCLDSPSFGNVSLFFGLQGFH